MDLRLDAISKKEINKIHENTLEILSKIGVEFSSEKALEKFRKKNTRIEGKKVYIDEKLLNWALSKTPNSFVLEGREKDRNVQIGGDRTNFAPASGPIFVTKKGERKPATCKDYIDFVKLIDTSEVININSAVIVEPQEIDIKDRNMYRVANCLKYSSKPFIGFTNGRKNSKECIELVQRFSGKIENVVLGIISPISPLKYDESMIEGIITYSEKKQPFAIASASLPGATSPVTIAGTLAVNNAEVLAGIVLSQIVRPGNPVIYGNTSTSCDMRYMSNSIGSPETALITLATAKMGEFYKLPTRSGGSLTDSKIPDIQAGIESTLTMLAPISSGIDFVLQSCGILESFNSVSFEKMIIDEELIKQLLRFKRGFRVDKKTIGLDSIRDQGSGGMFIGEEHTINNFRQEQYISKLFSKDNYDNWCKKGKCDLNIFAEREVLERLKNYKKIDITEEQIDLISKYI